MLTRPSRKLLSTACGESKQSEHTISDETTHCEELLVLHSALILYVLYCRDEIREATSSMTSVPKPLKFLRPHYDGMKEFFQDMMDSSNKTAFSEVLSVLGMTMAGYIPVIEHTVHSKLFFLLHIYVCSTS